MNPRLMQSLRSVGQGALWFCALNFAALVIAAVALMASGTVTPARWRGSMRVIWGTSEAVGVQELARLHRIEEREKERAAQLSNRNLIESWQRLRGREEELDARAAGLRARLEELRDNVAAERDAVVRERSGFRAERAKLEAERLSREAELAAFASERARRIYRYMRPAAVAADLVSRMREGPDGKEKVAAVVKRLPERTVAEVLESMDPVTRNEIYDLMRTPPALEGTGGRARTEAQGEAE